MSFGAILLLTLHKLETVSWPQFLGGTEDSRHSCQCLGPALLLRGRRVLQVAGAIEGRMVEDRSRRMNTAADPQWQQRYCGFPRHFLRSFSWPLESQQGQTRKVLST